MNDAAARMVETQLRARGIRDERVLAAMRAVRRDLFVPPHLRDYAWDDGPLPIGGGQTISQPYVVALMIEAAEVGAADRVLDVGTGSGYAAAVLARIAQKVRSIEVLPDLADAARARLAALGGAGIEVRVGDGSHGWPDGGAFDAILVAAGASRVPEALRDQLAPGGRLVMPVGRPGAMQDLVRLRRGHDGAFRQEGLGTVAFVPLVTPDPSRRDVPDTPGEGTR